MSELKLIEIGCYGKLPVHPEYIVEGNGVSNSGFNQWIADGLAAGRAEWDDTYREKWEGFAGYDFIWPAADGAGALLGRMRPSADSGGRRHPFIMFGVVTGADSASPARLLQAIGGTFHERLGALLDHVTIAAGDEDARARVRGAAVGLDLSPSEDFAAYLGKTRVADLFAAIEIGHPQASRHHVLLSLGESTFPFRGRELDRIPFAIRVPLSGSGDRAREVEFWIELLTASLRKDLAGAMCLWSDPTVAVGAHLFVFFASPTATQFTSLIDPDADIETISYLDRPYGSKPPEERIDPGLRGLLASETSTLAELLDAVGRL
jgi:type VI secretion system ImpM family protein